MTGNENPDKAPWSVDWRRANGQQTRVACPSEVCAGCVSDILNGGCYPIVGFLPPEGVKFIVDVGANVGAAALLFTEAYPQARVLAFEPSPRSLPYLRANVSSRHKVDVVAVGLLDRDCLLPLHPGMDCVQDSLVDNQESVVHGTLAYITVKAASSELRGLPIDILKIDTEGSEFLILADLPRATLEGCQVIYLEVHQFDGLERALRLLCPPFLLFWGRIDTPARATLCFVRRDLIPPGHPALWEIIL